MEIKKVLICGLGAVGLTYAYKLKNVCELKILADEKRVERYKNNPPIFNGEVVKLDYITPKTAVDCTGIATLVKGMMEGFDLIIIATKNDGLDSAIEYIKNFVGKNTIIISLLNGITSEERIAEVYGRDKVLHSYFIGHSCMRDGNKVIQDGVQTIVYGSPYEQNREKVEILKNFFEKNNIGYSNPEDIIHSQWLKYTFNTYVNQLSAVTRLTFGEMLKMGQQFEDMARNVIKEVILIAQKEGVNHPETLEKEALDCLKMMIPEGKTSMLQDIEAGRKTEVEIFSGEIIKRGKKYGISTPFNLDLYNKIKALEK